MFELTDLVTEYKIIMDKFPNNIRESLEAVTSLMERHLGLTFNKKSNFVNKVYSLYCETNNISGIIIGINEYIKGKYYESGKGEHYLFAIIKNTCDIARIKYQAEQNKLDKLPPEVL